MTVNIQDRRLTRFAVNHVTIPNLFEHVLRHKFNRREPDSRKRIAVDTTPERERVSKLGAERRATTAAILKKTAPATSTIGRLCCHC
jgi:hypothetical protein